MNKWLSLFGVLVCCQTQKEAPSAEKPAVAPIPSATSAPAPPASVTAQQMLDRLDTRTPVPLLPMMANHQKQNMRDHLAAVQEIIAAAAKDDFDAVETAVGRIGFSEQMGQMCEHMGSGAPGFAETALRFHRNASKIGDAAGKHDRQQVLTLLGQTLGECTGCHQTYKQHVVDEAEWAAAARSAPPHHRMD